MQASAAPGITQSFFFNNDLVQVQMLKTYDVSMYLKTF